MGRQRERDRKSAREKDKKKKIDRDREIDRYTDKTDMSAERLMDGQIDEKKKRDTEVHCLILYE